MKNGHKLRGTLRNGYYQLDRGVHELLFEKDGLKVSHLQSGDQHLMAKWLSTPAVLEFYEGRDCPFTLEMVMEKFFKTEKDIERCLVEYNNEKQMKV